ncbi:MAG: hypothetical protein H6718_19595 [Polyangiaceae bacterium]|nr:hypothetical protein [Myxococcales bacterium]MCB9587616.1 hypothetical protein [Polyangiaceae bacterium]MCB9605587.1 hypothetical protein [Polyangiaceae bacterium]
MSAGLWPILNPASEASPTSDGALLLQNIEELDEIAHAIGALPLTSFADLREVPEDFDGEPEELEELLGPWEDWFPVAEGVEAMRRCAEALAIPEHAESVEHPAELKAELSAFADYLERATSDQTFRLEFIE